MYDDDNPNATPQDSNASADQMPKAQHEDHGKNFRGLVFKRGGVSTKYVLERVPPNKGDAFLPGVEITFRASKCASSKSDEEIEYDVFIQKKHGSGTDTYSLITLGIQSAIHHVRIRRAIATGGGASIRRGQFEVDLTTSGECLLEKATRYNSGFLEETVGFLTFSGDRCSMIVSPASRDKLPTKWDEWPEAEMQTSHDNMPPGGTSER